MPHLCGLRAMEARWISTLICGRAAFSSVRVEVFLGGVHVVGAESLSIKSTWLHPIFAATTRSLCEWCGPRRILLVVGISESSFIIGYFFLFVFRSDIVF
jgi:hypothetical protein